MAATGEILRTEVVDERAARRSLREQIARLERELATVVIAGFPTMPLPSGAGGLDHGSSPRGAGGPGLDHGSSPCAVAGPRLLALGDLERTRDALAARVSELRAAAADHAERHAAARLELERMLADPPAHRWRRLSNAELGLPGCTTYHVRPRAGLLGMLMGWWQVKVSGGCP
jgi:hypothetical protein